MGCGDNLSIFNDATSVKKDFILKNERKKYDIYVKLPDKQKEKYPLVIYHHERLDRSFDYNSLRKTANRFAAAGYMVWLPVRRYWNPDYAEDLLREAERIADEIYKGALRSSAVDNNNINIVGISIGANAVLSKNIKAEKLKTVSLVGFGPPLNNIFMYGEVYKIINNTVYNDIKTSIIIIESEGEDLIDLMPVEYVRKKMSESGVDLRCVQYKYKSHKELIADVEVIDEVIKFLKGKEPINNVENFKINKKMIKKWERFRRTGYW